MESQTRLCGGPRAGPGLHFPACSERFLPSLLPSCSLGPSAVKKEDEQPPQSDTEPSLNRPDFQRDGGAAAADRAESELSCRSPALKPPQTPPELRSLEERRVELQLSRAGPGRAEPSRAELSSSSAPLTMLSELQE